MYYPSCRNDNVSYQAIEEKTLGPLCVWVDVRHSRDQKVNHEPLESSIVVHPFYTSCMGLVRRRPCNSSFPYYFLHLSQFLFNLLYQGSIFFNTHFSERHQGLVPKAINNEWWANDHRYPGELTFHCKLFFAPSLSLILILPDGEVLVIFDVLYLLSLFTGS